MSLFWRSHEGSGPAAGPRNHQAAGTRPTTKPRFSGVAAVAQSGAAQFKTIAEALALVGPNATIQILDDAVYEGPVVVDEERFRGLRIESPRHAALKSASGAPLLSIKGTPDVVVDGLRLLARPEQHALWIGGPVSGVRVENVECTHPSGAKCGVAVIDQAVGAAESPLVVRRCTFEDDYAGLAVVGQAGSPVSWLRVEECRFRMAAAGVALTMENAVQQVSVSYCVFTGGGGASGIHIGDNSRDVSVANNTFFQTSDWVGFNPDSVVAGVSARRNLVLESRLMLHSGTDLQRVVDLCLSDNWWELAADADVAQVRAVCAPREPLGQIPVASRDPANAEFLQLPPYSPLANLPEQDGATYIGAMPPRGRPAKPD